MSLQKERHLFYIILYNRVEKIFHDIIEYFNNIQNIPGTTLYSMGREIALSGSLIQFRRNSAGLTIRNYSDILNVLNELKKSNRAG
ncbi:MAG: hypothetical protein V3S06_03880, partial [candidate division Zixibacteria bacterium]